MIKVDLTDHIPIYIQIMNQIKHKVAVGELQPGDQLPTVRQLAADLRINFNTVARAYRLLDEEQIISTQHGRGTFILEPVSEEQYRTMRRKDLVRLLNHFLNEAEALGFGPEVIGPIFDEQLMAWEQQGSPPNPDDL
jgi:GntR family transcriptional regulator